jgi:hypothetical protein
MPEKKEDYVLIMTVNNFNPILDELIEFCESKGYKLEPHIDENLEEYRKTFILISSK